MKKTIEIRCHAAATLDIAHMQPFQKDLKSLSKVQFDQLKKAILETGFAFPINIWTDGENSYVLGGHQRLRVLQSLRDEGYDIPPVPVSYIDADSYQQAKVRVLQDVAQYGLIESQGLYEFMDDAEIGVNQLMSDFRLPALNMDEFKAEFFEDSSNASGGKDVGALARRFVVPPFSVLDTRQGYWTERKDTWLEAMGERGETREGTLSKGGDNIVAGINNGVSILDPVLAEAMIKWFTKPGSFILDPFAGDTVFGYVAKYLGHHFVGIELREEQVKLNQQRCDEILNAEAGSAVYKLDTSENVDTHLPEPECMDFLFSCPPYYDLEVYSDNPQDLSAQETYTQFRTLIECILKKCVLKLRTNSFACLVVSELRDKQGGYYNFVGDIVRTMTEAGLTYYNELVLLNAVGTAQMRANRYMVNRKMVRVHQNVLVFYKGNTKNISSHFPNLAEYDEETNAALASDSTAQTSTD